MPLTPNQILYGDSRQVLATFDDNSVSLIITSPPYKNEDGFDPQIIQEIFRQCYRVLKSGGLFFLNFGHLAEDKFRPFSVCFQAIAEGFKLNETFTWVKNHFRPIQGKKRVNNLTEFVFLLYKESMPDLDRLSIGVPYVDQSNAKRFNGGRNLRCRGNIWEIPYQTINKKEEKLHNDRFPVQLPEFCIKISGVKSGEVVLDPFAGSCTTAIAARNLGMLYIMIERQQHYCQIGDDRLKVIQTI